MGVEPTTFWVQIRCSSQTELRPHNYWLRFYLLLQYESSVCIHSIVFKFSLLLGDLQIVTSYRSSTLTLHVVSTQYFLTKIQKIAGIPGFEPGTNRLTVYCATAAPYPLISWGGGNRTPILGTKILCLAVRRRLNSKFIVLTTLERKTRLELATFSLEGWRSTNWVTSAK